MRLNHREAGKGLYESNNKQNILNYSPEELETVIAELGEKKFRASQVFGWLAKGVTCFDDMKNVPAALRAALEEKFYIGIPEAVRKQESKDGTVKCLFEFAIPYASLRSRDAAWAVLSALPPWTVLTGALREERCSPRCSL